MQLKFRQQAFLAGFFSIFLFLLLCFLFLCFSSFSASFFFFFFFFLFLQLLPDPDPDDAGIADPSLKTCAVEKGRWKQKRGATVWHEMEPGDTTRPQSRHDDSR